MAKKSISRNVLFRSKCQERLRITAWQTNLGTWKNSRLNERVRGRGGRERERERCKSHQRESERDVI